MERTKCPYCGEEIAATAKKCRFCGEWLPQQAEQQAEIIETVQAETVEPRQTLTVAEPREDNMPMVNPAPQAPAVNPGQSPAVMANQQPNQGLQQNIIVQPQIVVENRQEVHQEQNVHVQVKSGGEESKGCLWSQLVIVAIGLGIAFKSFWYGVAAFILLVMGVYIPYLGHVMCVVLGAAFGIMAGVLSAAFGAATWVAWLIGIVAGLGLIAVNLEQRKSEVDED